MKRVLFSLGVLFIAVQLFAQSLEIEGHLTRAGWFDCPCCPTNLIRFLPSIPALIYDTDKKGIYVNLFVSNEARIAFGNTDVNITQVTDYPHQGNIKLQVDPEKNTPFSLRIRIPDWATNKPASALYKFQNALSQPITVLLNGKKIKVATTTNGYVEIDRTWTKGDRVEVHFPFEIREVLSSALVAENKGKVSVQCGPLVYCMEGIDNRESFGKAFRPKNFRLHYHPSKLGGINEIIAKDNNTRVWNLIPYYSWSNRGVGTMKVWLNKE